MDDTFQVKLFGGDKGKACLEIKTHLVAKGADGSRACTVAFLNAVI